DRVLEGERAGEPRLLDHPHRLLEVLFGLAGESHDDVGGDRRVGDASAHPLQDAEEPLTAI
ncbi:hypothetical protein ABE10_00750, partial [Bacillus toyonensis]|nr:hypothetical protein [Bacillus toyonensis]